MMLKLGLPTSVLLTGHLSCPQTWKKTFTSNNQMRVSCKHCQGVRFHYKNKHHEKKSAGHIKYKYCVIPQLLGQDVEKLGKFLGKWTRETETES